MPRRSCCNTRFGGRRRITWLEPANSARGAACRDSNHFTPHELAMPFLLTSPSTRRPATRPIFANAGALRRMDAIASRATRESSDCPIILSHPMELQPPNTREPFLRSHDQPLAVIPVEDLTHLVLEREKLDPHELARCRCEVLLQLALFSPWTELDAPEAPHPGLEHVLLVWRRGGFATSSK
jgi:hypothetical protein